MKIRKTIEVDVTDVKQLLTKFITQKMNKKVLKIDFDKDVFLVELETENIESESDKNKQ
jgi:hypothetical protein